MNMTTLPPVAQALAEKGAPFRLFYHQRPIRSLEQAAAERGQRPEQVIRSIVFRLAADEFVLVLAAGPGQLDWGRLRAHLGRSRMTMARPEEVLAATGYPIGAVGPFGLAQPLRLLADRRVFAPEEVSFGSGERNVAVIMRQEDFRRALGEVEIGDFMKAQENSP